MRVDIEHFSGKEIERVYLASTVDEAERVEELLDRAAFPYTVDVEKYRRTVAFLFSGMRAGLGFYVTPENAAECKRLLVDSGFKAGIELE